MQTNLIVSLKKVTQWEEDGTLPPQCPTANEVNALLTELGQFSIALKEASKGLAGTLERIFIGNFSHIMDNYQQSMNAVFDAIQEKGQPLPLDRELFMEASDSIKVHFLNHFNEYLKEKAIAPGRA